MFRRPVHLAEVPADRRKFGDGSPICPKTTKRVIGAARGHRPWFLGNTTLTRPYARLNVLLHTHPNEGDYVDRDRRGRRRRPGQQRGLRPMHPLLPERWVSRALRVAMSELDWRRLEATGMSSRPASAPAMSRVAQRPGVRSPGNREIVHLEPGDRVTHDTFGLGTVTRVEGVGDKAVAHIDFRSEGSKRLLLRYAPVTKL